MDAAIAISNTGLSDLSDPLSEIGLLIATRLVMIARPSGLKHRTCSANADIPDPTQLIDKLPAMSRP
jgi:hypothetical protein